MRKKITEFKTFIRKKFFGGKYSIIVFLLIISLVLIIDMMKINISSIYDEKVPSTPKFFYSYHLESIVYNLKLTTLFNQLKKAFGSKKSTAEQTETNTECLENTNQASAKVQVTEFPSVNDMIDAGLTIGINVTTLGYYTENDGGAAQYSISKYPSTDFCPSIRLSNGLYANLIIQNNSINVNQFGAYGDGIHDDSLAIQNAINSGIPNIIFYSSKYKCSSPIVFSTDNVKINGNCSTLFTDNDYIGMHEMFIKICANNITINSLNISSFETCPVGYKTQLGIVDASDLLLENCTLTIPNSVSKITFDGLQKEYTNLDLYSGWHNVEINNCNLINKSGCDAGSCIWIRDIQSKTASNLNFTNNKLYKNSHDEILAIFSGSIKDINIYKNSITTDEINLESPSDFCFTFGSQDSILCDNIIFESNEINCSSIHFLAVFGNCSNVKLNNNIFNYKKLGEDALYVFTTYKDAKVNSLNVYNNTFNIDSQIDISIMFDVDGIYSKNIINTGNATVNQFSGAHNSNEDNCVINFLGEKRY